MAEINLRKEHLRKKIVTSLAHQLGDLEIWPGTLLDALEDEIAGREGRFLLEVERILNQVDDQGLIVRRLEHDDQCLAFAFPQHAARSGARDCA